MASNKIFNSQPAFIATAGMTTACNLFNCTITTLTPQGIGFAPTQPYGIMKHVVVHNILTTSAINVTLYKGTSLTTANGAQWGGFSSVSIPAQSYAQFYGQARFDSGDYLTGLSSLPLAAVINMEGEIGIS
jgi:hypothetical protein